MHNIPKVFLIISLLGLTFSDMERREPNHYFAGGEELTFKVRYLFFNAAEAKMAISNTIYQIQNRPTYKIDVTGRTLNIFKIFYVNDNWVAVDLTNSVRTKLKAVKTFSECTVTLDASYTGYAF